MSTRAYRLIKIETEDAPSFNLSREYDIFSRLGSEGDDGIFSLNVDDLEKWLKTDEAKQRGVEYGDNNEALKQDLKIAKKEMEEYIDYYCY